MRKGFFPRLALSGIRKNRSIYYPYILTAVLTTAMMYIIGSLQNVTTDLAPAIHFYLDGLKNWNTALVHAANKIADYTSGRIVKRLQAAIKEGR